MPMETCQCSTVLHLPPIQSLHPLPLLESPPRREKLKWRETRIEISSQHTTLFIWCPLISEILVQFWKKRLKYEFLHGCAVRLVRALFFSGMSFGVKIWSEFKFSLQCVLTPKQIKNKNALILLCHCISLPWIHCQFLQDIFSAAASLSHNANLALSGRVHERQQGPEGIFEFCWYW